jgi:hypothetical protein
MQRIISQCFLRLFRHQLPWLLGILLWQMLSACTPLGITSQTTAQLPCESALAGYPSSAMWQQVGVNIWFHAGSTDALSAPSNYGQISNVVFVLEHVSARSRGWLVGSGPDAATGRALACSVLRDLGQQVTDVISTRAHPESVLGAGGLTAVRHWALPEVQAAMAERCERCRQRLHTAVNGLGSLIEPAAMPNALITGKQLGPFDVMPVAVQPQQTIALLHHRVSNVWILPGVIWGHDVVPDLHEAQLARLLEVLEALAQFTPTRIVPEQGEVGDNTLIDRNRAYWTRLSEALILRWHRGENNPGGASGLTPLTWAHTGLDGRLRDQLNAQRAWQQIENTGFDDQL